MGDLRKTKTKRSEKHQLPASGEQNNRMCRSGTRETSRNVYRWTSKNEPANIRVCLAVAQWPGDKTTTIKRRVYTTSASPQVGATYRRNIDTARGRFTLRIITERYTAVKRAQHYDEDYTRVQTSILPVARKMEENKPTEMEFWRRLAGHSVRDIFSSQTIRDELRIFIVRIRSQNARRISIITLHEWTQAEHFVMLWLTGRWGVRRRTSDRKNVGRLREGGGGWGRGRLCSWNGLWSLPWRCCWWYVALSAPEFHWNQIQVPQIIIRSVFQKKKKYFAGRYSQHTTLLHDKNSIIKKES
jgi:hypothetical protein